MCNHRVVVVLPEDYKNALVTLAKQEKRTIKAVIMDMIDKRIGSPKKESETRSDEWDEM